MDSAVAVARLVAAAWLAGNGLRILFDQLNARLWVVTCGVPQRLVGAVVRALILGELAVAAGLLFGRAAWPAAAVALCGSLASVLTTAIAYARAKNARALSVLVRNMMLAVPAAV